MVHARQHVVPQSKHPNSASLDASCPHPHCALIVASIALSRLRALTLLARAEPGNFIVFIGPINFLDRKDLSHVGIIGPYRARRADKRGEWVEIGQVEAFLAVGTFGGFRRAADALRVTQPAISARIRALEESLGVPLFVRSQSGLTLSAAGRAFRPHAEQLLHAVALARETVSLRDDPLVLVARPDSQVARTRRVRLEDVAAQPLIFFDRGSSDWTLSHGLFRRAGLVPNVVLEVETIETAKRMVERGMGLAFLPHLAVVTKTRRRRLVGLELSDAEPLSRSLDVIHPRQRPLSQEALALLKTLRAAVFESGGAQNGGSRDGAVPRRAMMPARR